MLRSIINRILRSLFEVAAAQGDPEKVGCEIVVEAIRIFGWKPCASALADYAEENTITDQLHSYFRQSQVSMDGTSSDNVIE